MSEPVSESPRASDETPASYVQLAVPGSWPEREALIQAVADASGGRIEIVGDGLVDKQHNVQAQCEILGHQETMEMMFELGGRLEDEALDAVAAHKSVIHLRLRAGEAAAQQVLRLGCDLLDAGGHGIRVESSGRAHSPDQWRELAEEAGVLDDAATRGVALYRAFVVLVGPDEDDDEDEEGTESDADVDVASGGDYTSFGMQIVGRRDAVVADRDDLEDDPVELLERFLLYQLIDWPTLADGDTFSLGEATESTSRYRVSAQPDRRYPSDDPFYNPFGLWRLEPAAATA